MVELGQMAFGNKYEPIDAPKFVGAALYEISRRVAEHEAGRSLPDGSYQYGEDYTNEVFSMFPYYWGDCTCGYETEEWDWWEENPHLPDCFNTRYSDERERVDHLSFDESCEHMDTWAEQNGFPRGKPGVAVYCDCGTRESHIEWSETHDHSTDCLTVKPNFYHYATGLRVYWYKYIGRSMTMNQPVELRQWNDIVNDCLDSIPKI